MADVDHSALWLQPVALHLLRGALRGDDVVGLRETSSQTVRPSTASRSTRCAMESPDTSCPCG